MTTDTFRDLKTNECVTAPVAHRFQATAMYKFFRGQQRAILYRRIDNLSDEQINGLQPEGKTAARESKFAWSHYYMCLWTVSNIILFLLSVIFFTLSVQSNGKIQTRRQCLEYYSMPCKILTFRDTSCISDSRIAPILIDKEIRLERSEMPTTFVPLDSTDIFRQEPSHEVDLAWQSLYDTRPVPIGLETVLAIGKDPAQSVKVPESWGYGNDLYFGRIDVFQ